MHALSSRSAAHWTKLHTYHPTTPVIQIETVACHCCTLLSRSIHPSTVPLSAALHLRIDRSMGRHTHACTHVMKHIYAVVNAVVAVVARRAHNRASCLRSASESETTTTLSTRQVKVPPHPVHAMQHACIFRGCRAARVFFFSKVKMTCCRGRVSQSTKDMLQTAT